MWLRSRASPLPTRTNTDTQQEREQHCVGHASLGRHNPVIGHSGGDTAQLWDTELIRW